MKKEKNYKNFVLVGYGSLDRRGYFSKTDGSLMYYKEF